MTELTLPVTTVGTLRCQQTLEPLQQRDDGLCSPSADLLYPVRDGLVYMASTPTRRGGSSRRWRRNGSGRGRRWFPSDAGRSPVTSAIKRRARADLRSARGRRSPVDWVHEHGIGGGGTMVVLARKDVHVSRRARPGIRIIEPAQMRSTEEDRRAFAPLHRGIRVRR